MYNIQSIMGEGGELSIEGYMQYTHVQYIAYENSLTIQLHCKHARVVVIVSRRIQYAF